MPIYAYRCAECGFAKDVLQKFSDAPLTTCPECGKERFSKQLTAPAFQLKGSGWYVTDFRDGGKGKDAGKESDKAADKASDKASGKGAGGDAGKDAGAPGAAKAESPAAPPAPMSTTPATSKPAADSGKAA